MKCPYCNEQMEAEDFITSAYSVKHLLKINASCSEEISFTYAITVRIPDDDRDDWQPALVKIEECIAYYKENPDEGFLLLAMVLILVGGVSGVVAAIITALSRLIYQTA